MKILAVLGDFYHKEEVAKEATEQVVSQLKKESGEVEVNYVSVRQLVKEIETQPDLVILFAENRLNPQDKTIETWMDTSTAKAINRYVDAGGGWLAWHAGMASYENVEEYVAMLHGYFKYHPEKHQVVTYTSTPDTSFIDTNTKFEFLDEHYFVECDEENTNVFLKSQSVDGESIAGWAHEYGRGRVVCLTPAHLREGVLQQDFQGVLLRSIEWTCKEKQI